MGFFRSHKANRYTIGQIKTRLVAARKDIRLWTQHERLNKANDDEELEKRLKQWAEWRELLARKENENHSEVK